MAYGGPSGFLSRGPSPTGLAALLARPGLRDALMATGSALLAQKDQPGSFGGALGRALPMGMQAYQTGQEEAKLNELMQNAPPEMRQLLAALPAGQRGAALLSLMKPGDAFTLSPGEKRFTASGQQVAAVPESAPDPTDEMRNFAAFLQLSPEQMAAFEKYVKMKQSGPSVVVNTGDKAQETEIGKYWGQKYGQIMDGAQLAPNKLAQLDQLESLLSMPGVYQGTGGQAVLDAKRLARSLGIEVEGVAETEAASAIGREMALSLRNPAGGAGMPGALSDKDREFLESMTPGLSKTAEGNRRIIQAQRFLAQRSLEVAELVRKYEAEHGRLDSGFQALVESTFAGSDPSRDVKRPAPAAPAGPAASAYTDLIPRSR